MRVQIWSYNYDPEPQGIAPLSRALAVELRALGHDVLVVAGHPHYPTPAWGRRLRPYRERRDGIPVLRLPLWVGRETGAERIRQELSFALMQSLVSPLLPDADVLIAVTPCFPALAPAMVFSKLRRTPWVMWLQDIVTDGAATTELIDDGPVLRVARAIELLTYRSADRVVVISDAFRGNLLAKGVDPDKLVQIFNPATREPAGPIDVERRLAAPRILAMGNIGHTQGLDQIVDAFQGNAALEAIGAELVIAGHGVAADGVRRRIHSDRIRMTGVLYGDQLEPELQRASIGLVSQRAGLKEFNLPSKLMTYLAYGIPVIASVDSAVETARIVRDSGAGWVTNAARPTEFAELAAAKLADPAALREASRAGFAYAEAHFRPDAFAGKFVAALDEVRRADR